MTPQQFLQQLERQQEELRRCVQRTLPVKVGRVAKDHFQANFEKGGFVDGGLHKWKPAKRIGSGKGAGSKYRTLLSGRNHLFSSIESVPGNAEVHIQNKVPYAAVHNEGLKAGRGKGFIMPKRQFIGQSKEVYQKAKRYLKEQRSLNKVWFSELQSEAAL